MTISPLAVGTLPHHGKFSSRKGAKIFRIIVHHWAGVSGGDTTLTNPNVAASANYLIYSNGKLRGQVPEEYRAWTSGSSAADNPSITVEIQNTKAGDPWPVSETAIDTLTRLIVDVAKRYKWGGIVGSNVRGHYEFKATACPGPTLKKRIPSITDQANVIFNGGSANTPKPPTNNDKSLAQLVADVLAGKYGNGAARAKALGDRYNEVQEAVNAKLGIRTPQANPPKVDIKKLAKDTIAGKYGNGEARKKALGSNYLAVQSEVNRMLTK